MSLVRIAVIVTELLSRAVLGPLLLGDVLVVAAWIIGGIGLIYHAAYATARGYEGRLQDTNPQTWASAMLLFLSLQVSIRLRFPPSTCRVVILVVTTLYTAITFMNFLLYAIGASPSPTAFFYFVACVFCALTVAVLLGKAVAAEAGSSAPIAVEEGAGSSVPAPKDETSESSQSLLATVLLGYNGFNMAITLLFLVLLMVGAGYQAQSVSYPLIGKYTTAGGYRIAYNCEGPTNSGRPTILMDCDGSHGMMDFWPLQAAFTAAGRRSCIFDKPGIGWSDNFFASQNLSDFSNFYGDMIRGFGETGPYTFLAWGGGGQAMFEFGAANPTWVSSFVFLDVYFANVEWRLDGFYKNRTAAEEQAERELQLWGRNNIFTIIRGLGVPWGLMGIFIGGNASAYKYPARYNMYRWFYLTGKTWTTQFFFFNDMRKNGEDLAFPKDPYSLGNMPRVAPLLRGKPILQIVDNRTQQVVCKDTKTTEECTKKLWGQALLLNDATRVAQLTGNGTVAICAADDCGLDMTYVKPDFIVSTVMSMASYF